VGGREVEIGRGGVGVRSERRSEGGASSPHLQLTSSIAQLSLNYRSTIAQLSLNCPRSTVRFLLEGDIGTHRILLLFAVECRLHLERGVACRLVTYRGRQ
jgi:hypothetical protein